MATKTGLKDHSKQPKEPAAEIETDVPTTTEPETDVPTTKAKPAERIAKLEKEVAKLKKDQTAIIKRLNEVVNSLKDDDEILVDFRKPGKKSAAADDSKKNKSWRERILGPELGSKKQ